jgi:hypothetical protein
MQKEAFEVWCYRRMMRISWMDRVTKEEVFRRTGEKSLWKNLVKGRDELVGHLLRHGGILKTTIEGIIEVRNYRGRSRLANIRQIMKDVDQGWANYGPRKVSKMLKKMRFRKTFENHVHVCFVIFVRTSFFQHEASKKQC